MRAGIFNFKTAANRLIVTTLLLTVIAAASGCGLQTDEANRQLAEANRHQQEAEAVMERFKAFPAEWEALFNVSKIGGEQVESARQLLQAREQDLDTLDTALEQWEEAMGAIAELNVEQEIKEYVRLEISAIKCWQEYVTTTLRPLIMAYGGMVEIIAYARPVDEQSAKAEEITDLINDATRQLEECAAAAKQAEDYFKENRLGR